MSSMLDQTVRHLKTIAKLDAQILAKMAAMEDERSSDARVDAMSVGVGVGTKLDALSALMMTQNTLLSDLKTVMTTNNTLTTATNTKLDTANGHLADLKTKADATNTKLDTMNTRLNDGLRVQIVKILG